MEDHGRSQWRRRGKMEPRRVCMEVVADSLQLDEEQDPDPLKSRIRIRIRVKYRIRIRSKVKKRTWIPIRCGYTTLGVTIETVKRLTCIYGSRSLFMSGMLHNFFFLGRTFLLRMTTPRSRISRRWVLTRSSMGFPAQTIRSGLVGLGRQSERCWVSSISC